MSQKYRLENFRYILGLFAFVYLCDVVCAYSGLIPVDPANPGKCFYRGDLLTLGVNDGISPCQRLTCYEDGSILIEGHVSMLSRELSARFCGKT
ncbi:uncharacterized protein LOC115626893 isoform X2 [Scaptodrosophila lebanonensis]|uniref:Uncharacterized protein LOC115626893 isoform X2 n=1 Tax=Drosophila lebanonensis TaxID=7225 RepID=A0A6J2TSZ0_DROLE|nr:uncharacterized protein LOC115626893 isoform X2 [Scaptodrosophila lebanonensis]